MNRKEFFSFLDSKLEGKTLEQKVNEIDKINAKEWFEQYLDHLTKNMIFCPECKKYVSEKKFKKEVIKEIRRETTYRDAGYGDDDRTGDVECLVEYIVCPLCGHKKQKDKWRLRIIREYDRSGNVYNR